MTDQTYRPWALDNPLRRWLAPPRKDVDRLGLEPGQRVADLGAGVGYYAEEVLSRLGDSGHLTMVDINAENLQRFARRHGPDPRVDAVVGSAASVSTIPSQSQDRALVANLLCDVEDKKGVLDETWRILRMGGLAFVSFHWSPRASLSHPLRLTPELWRKLSSEHPWEVLGTGGGRKLQWHVLQKPPSPPVGGA
jgi:ubiquinone/menaquinone biosynthesis C-methylase UbiE